MSVQRLILPSPFDHAERSALYAPKGMPAPGSTDYESRFDDEALNLLSLSQGGALLLFTSHRAMNRAVERLEPALISQGLSLLHQGEAPKQQLLDALRNADADRPAALFATQSFWEGVDVKGPALRMVIIDRLPFRSPGDPLVQARCELIEAEGGSSFTSVSLPEAALSLKQGAGRLLRDEQDVGVVAILDGRLRTKRYGDVFLRALPPMMRIGSFKALQSFWEKKIAPFVDANTPSKNPDPQ